MQDPGGFKVLQCPSILWILDHQRSQEQMQLFFSPTVPSRVEIRDASTDSTWSEKNGAQKICPNLLFADRSNDQLYLAKNSQWRVQLDLWYNFPLKEQSAAGVFFCSTGLPLSNTRQVKSAFSSYYPLSSNLSCWLTLATSIIFSAEIFWKC